MQGQLVAPPITNHYSLIGTAFDYLLRFYLKRLNSQAVERKWVAEEAVKILETFSIIKDVRKDILALLGGDLEKVERFISDLKKHPKMLEHADNILMEAKANYSAYIKSGKLNDELIKSAIFIAQLDSIYRVLILNPDLGTADEGDIEDLRNLIANVNDEHFRAEKTCILNPIFGQASNLVGGADADLIIDHTLIDIKTTKNLEFKSEAYHQLIGYYILVKIGGIDHISEKLAIDQLGVYYSRYGLLYTFPVSSIEKDNFLGFIEWFKTTAGKYFEA